MKIGYRQVRFIFYAAALFIPFTSLRFGFIGLGEILFLAGLILLTALNRGTFRVRGELSHLTRFWVVYLFLIMLGFSYNVLFLDSESISIGGAAFDFFSYVVVFSALLFLGDERLYQGSTPESFFKVIFSLWSVAFGFLFFLSMFTPSILGYPLRYYAYFSPLVDNVHQAAMITAAMPFVMWHLALKPQPFIWRAFFLASGALFVAMALDSGATKAMMAVVVGVIVSCLVFVWRVIPANDRASRFLMIGAVSTGSVLFAFYNLDFILSLGEQFFQENDGHSARENLYKIGFEVAMDSFIFGHGPGQHVSLADDGFFSDAHNSALTLFLQGGVFAIVAFIISSCRIAWKIRHAVLLAGSLSAILMYLIGGDILRRLPIWIVIAGVVYLSAPRKETSRTLR